MRVMRTMRSAALAAVAVPLLAAALASCGDAAIPAPTAPAAPATARLDRGIEKVAVCHQAGSTAAPRFEPIDVAGSAVPAHLAQHGDYLVTDRTPCPPPAAPGEVKLCKAVAPGIPAGTPFPFTLSGEPVTVAAGQCVTRAYRVGTTVTVHEVVPAATALAALTVAPAAAGTADLGAATARVVVGTDVATVTFTNRSTVDGLLTVCKRLSVGTTVPAGTQFAFTVAGQAVSVAPGACASMIVAAGSVPVAETGPSAYQVSAIRFVTGSGTADVAAGSATATVVAGQATEVEFTNRQATGTLAICQVYVPGPTSANAPTSFVYEVHTGTGMTPMSVPVGACASRSDVPAGQVLIVEATTDAYLIAPFKLVDIRFLTGTGTANVPWYRATATIVAGQTTTVEFTHHAHIAFIQLCKETTGGLTGTVTFTSPSFVGTQSITVAAGATQPVCAPATAVSAGGVTVTEGPAVGSTLAGVRFEGPPPYMVITVSGRTVSFGLQGNWPPHPIDVTRIIFRNAPP